MRILLVGTAILNLLLFFSFFITKGYPWVFIFLHFLSLLPILFIATKKAILALQIAKKEYIVIAIIFTFSIILRLYNIGTLTPGMQGDEVIVAYSAKELGSSYSPFTTSNFGHGTMIPYMVLIATRIFGDTITSIRFPSAIFGGLGVIVFYLLLRFYFKPSLAFAGSLFFAFAYTNIALSRVIYEPTAAIFFQIIAILFLLLAIKKKDFFYYAALGIILGLGNYTYINFRLFTLFSLLLLCGFLILQKFQLQKKILFLSTAVIFLVVGIMPLGHYFLIHPDQLVARAAVLSIFNQNLSMQEIISNIHGNISQLRYIFLSPGDPNFRINPGKTAMFDITTIVLAFIGFIYLIKRNIKVLILVGVLSLPFIVSDILAYESGPANTFYGFAHPNTLRISGIIPFVILCVTFGLYGLKKIIERSMKDNQSSEEAIQMTKNYGVVVLLIFSFFINYSLYFMQSYDPYTHTVNGVAQLKLVQYVNTMDREKKIYASTQIIDDIRFTYFLKKDHKVLLFNPKTLKEATKIINESDLVLINSNFDLGLITELIEHNPTNKRIMVHKVMDGIDAFLFTSDQELAIDDFWPI
ncbi:MAG: glycosyltransferase family 39 protein [Candidatus Levybacteria bacterium]|nr:glycosyltransferase family 39 protein [Candidatus Levybacteria bacterium]